MTEISILTTLKSRGMNIIYREDQKRLLNGFLVESPRGFASCEPDDEDIKEALVDIFMTHRYAIGSYLKRSDTVTVTGCIHFDTLEDAKRFANHTDDDGNRTDYAIYDVKRQHYTQM